MSISKRQRLMSGVGALSVIALAASPFLASAASNTANTTINATVASVITISTATPVTISLTPTAGGVVTTASDTVTVNTNNTAGYNLMLADVDTNMNLVSGANNIAAHTGTFAAPTALTGNSWGYAIVGAPFDGSYSVETNNASSSSKWAGMPTNASPVTLKTTAAVATNDTTTVWYGVRATSAQPNGAYTDAVVYTATTNP